MGELILCKGRLSENPYYIVGLGMNIYSIEELCFYLVRDAYILDNDIMDEKLCDYIEKELELPELSEVLKTLLARNVSLGQFVTTLLEAVGYIEDDELRKIKQILVDNASLSFSEKRKKRADNLLNSMKLTRAIDEYQYILNTLRPGEDDEMCARIYHNTGVAYARLFMYDKAAYYFREAYNLLKDETILIHYLQALRLTMNRERYERFVLRMGYDESLVLKAEEELFLVKNEKPDSEYQKQIDSIIKLKEEGKISAYFSMTESTFSLWKQEYRDKMVARSLK